MSKKNAQAAYDQALVDLSYAEIYSPIDGVVLDRAVEVGQTVAASFSTPTLFTLANDLTKMQVEAAVDEADIGQVKIGQKVTFTVDAYTYEERQDRQPHHDWPDSGVAPKGYLQGHV